MKRFFAIMIVSILLLSGCTVGPEEKPREPFGSGDVTMTVPPVPEQPVEPETSPTETGNEDVDEPDEIIPPAATDPAETEPVITEAPVTTPDLEFDVEWYDEPQTMYATISLNVRSGPSTDFEAIGFLNEGQETAVIGIASTGWYEIEYGEGYGYVSGYYMTDVNPNLMPEPDGNYLSYPQLDPLDHAAKATIKEDYEKANGLSAGEAYIAAYYGTYSGGDAVVMWMWDDGSTDVSRPMTSDINEFTVAGRQFYLESGSLSMTIHTAGGQFIELADAYAQGLVTESELDMISYYNLPSWYNE